MLKHIVFFKFRKDVQESGIADFEKALGGLPGTISEIIEFQFGRDILHTERSYDFALVSGFENLEAMKRYQVHPAHQAVLVKVRELCESVLAVDFEY